jgi:uncharacterized protein (TIGR00661 family)
MQGPMLYVRAMRILYGVVGEGMGHAIRSRVILDELVKQHDVHVVVSGRAYDYLKQRASEHLAVQKIWGFTIVAEDNEVSSFRTLLENAKGAIAGGWPQNVKAYFELAETFQPDVVVTDFESWSYLFAKNRFLPVISLDNIQMVSRCSHEPAITAGHEAEFQLAKGIVKSKAPGCFHYLITTFFYPEIRKKRTSLHPSILRPEILAAKPEAGDHLLVYQTTTSNPQLVEQLQALGLECRVYGLRRELKAPEREGNLVYMPFSEAGFIDDLRTCRGVVASGGYTLMGEAVYLRRPMLAVPVGRQFEQVMNARYLEKCGYGLQAEELTPQVLGAFLERLPDLSQNLAAYAQDGNREMLARLEQELQRAKSGARPEDE